MPVLRVVVLWHQHQPYYKDLVTGEYRLPWVRLHALKDYYGMVKVLDEFPNVHQTFNLVPSLITQIQDYVNGTARDPFLDVAAKAAKDLTSADRQFALQYLFQANPVHMIGRYPRYRELWEHFRNAGALPEKAEQLFQAQDFTDLQVLSQIAWFDEFFLDDRDIAGLIKKGRGYSRDDQDFVIARERELLARVLPAHAEAAQRGRIEISTSAFYHPILPLVCDTNMGAVSTPGLTLPQNRFRHPEDAREQLKRGLDLHQQVFGIRPQGVWPSEGSVSEEVFALAQGLGVKWMATDEEVLGRSAGVSFSRDGHGHLSGELASRLYTIHRFENDQTEMNLFFRDHTISDLIGFVYSGMPPQDAANHLMHNIRESAQPVLNAGRDAVVPIILDGENAWEYYPQSGREFLRRFYDLLQREPGVEAVTVSEAIARHESFGKITSLVPGSWIHANFNVWIGAPEDNRAWDYLYNARNFYAQAAPAAGTRYSRSIAVT
jgi:alpha-amylase/alpha-mannosidase (GH57 family)